MQAGHSGEAASGSTKGRQVLTLLLEGVGKGSTAVIGCALLAPSNELVTVACPPSLLPEEADTIS